MSGSPDDELARARARLEGVRERRGELRAEMAALNAPSDTQTDEGATRLRRRELELRGEQLEAEEAAAHTELGRAILDQFERDLAKLRIPMGDSEAARELTAMADNLRRACLTVLADWPELLDEARRRLALKPPGPTTLHG